MVHSQRQSRLALTVVELLIACAVICLLAGLLLPAIVRSRESARRVDCTHRLGQVGVALQAYHDTHSALPVGWALDGRGQSAYGWFAQVLPYADQAALFNEINPRRPLNDATNATAAATPLSLALCPSDVAEPLFALYQEIGSHENGGQRSNIVLGWFASANYVGVFGTREPDSSARPEGDGSFVEGTPVSFSQLERGLSNTLLVGERTAAKLPSSWIGFAVNGEDAPSRVVGFAQLGPNRTDSDESEFDSRHPGLVNFLWADAHVSPVFDTIDPPSYRGLTTRGIYAVP